MAKNIFMGVDLYMIISNFKFRPLKYSKTLPDKLIYRTTTEYFNSYVDKFIMFSTKRGDNSRAVMACFPELLERDGKNAPSLYIWRLFSNCSGSGLGRAMLDFAKVHSKRLGCNGSIHLFASAGYAPNRIPHIFYRKCGFSTDSARIDSKLDKFIRKHKNARYLDFKDTCMFYPPIEHFEDNTLKKIFNKILGFN